MSDVESIFMGTVEMILEKKNELDFYDESNDHLLKMALDVKEQILVKIRKGLMVGGNVDILKNLNEQLSITIGQITQRVDALERRSDLILDLEAQKLGISSDDFKKWTELLKLKYSAIIDEDDYKVGENGIFKNAPGYPIPNQALELSKDSNKKVENIFLKIEYEEVCLDILRNLKPAVIDKEHTYIGNNKGIIPLWIEILRRHGGIIKPGIPDKTIKDYLNVKIEGLNLSKDASEFRKSYKSVAIFEADIKILLSQSSHNGKLGRLG